MINPRCHNSLPILPGGVSPIQNLVYSVKLMVKLRFDPVALVHVAPSHRLLPLPLQRHAPAHSLIDFHATLCGHIDIVIPLLPSKLGSPYLDERYVGGVADGRVRKRAVLLLTQHHWFVQLKQDFHAASEGKAIILFDIALSFVNKLNGSGGRGDAGAGTDLDAEIAMTMQRLQ